MRKTSDKPRQSTRYMANIPQVCQGHEKQGAPEIASHPDRGWGDSMTKKKTLSRMGSWNRKKGHEGKAEEIRRVHGLQVLITYLYHGWEPPLSTTVWTWVQAEKKMLAIASPSPEASPRPPQSRPHCKPLRRLQAVVFKFNVGLNACNFR